MAYPDFLLGMFAGIAAFTVFLVMGLVIRKRPEIHRSMMFGIPRFATREKLRTLNFEH